MSDADDEHVKYFSKFIHRRLKAVNQPQILTLDQARQVEKDEWYISTFISRLIECHAIFNVGWLGNIEAFALTVDAYRGELTLDEIKTMLSTGLQIRRKGDEDASTGDSQN